MRHGFDILKGFVVTPARRQGLQTACHLSLIALCAAFVTDLAAAQQKQPAEKNGEKVPADGLGKVEVVPEAQDSQIESRLRRILETTGWYDDLDVRVEEGIVYLSGVADTPEYKDWAGRLAGKTEGVVAVVNQIEPRERSAWDLTPALTEAKKWAISAYQTMPLILLGLFLLVLTWLATRLAKSVARNVLLKRVESPLLTQVAANAIAIPVLVIGVYLVLRISGLTGLAATVIGGTGLLGLVIGIAFRDIAENFLASVLISMQRPFQAGDLIQVDKHTGFVQRVTTRGTILMTLEGNHVQIPNATIYKNTIVNFTSNPNVRLDFIVGIGYEDSVSNAQEVAVTELKKHPAVLDHPEPTVLVDQLGAATVNLRCYFWTNARAHSALKVKSSVIRLVKLALHNAGVSMPDEAREVVFPQGVPVSTMAEKPAAMPAPQPAKTPAAEEKEEVVTTAEGGLRSEAAEIEQQARESRLPDEGADLLENSRQASASASPEAP